MKRSINQKQLLSLITELEKQHITLEQFQFLLERPDLASIPREVYRLLEVVDPKTLIEQLLQANYPFTILSILKKYYTYRSDLQKRNFLFQYHDHLLLKSIADLLHFDFIFEDQELVQFILERSVDNQDQNYFQFKNRSQKICECIFEDFRSYLDGRKNSFIKGSFLLQSDDSVASFLKLANIGYFQIDPNWQEYLIKYYNGYSSKDVKEILPSILERLQEYGRIGTIHKRFTKILMDEELTDEAKEQKFSLLLSNICKMDLNVICRDSYFYCVSPHLLENTEEFQQYIQYAPLFTSVNCPTDSALYRTIRSIPDIHVRDTILEAMTTSLRDFITLDFIETVSTYHASKVGDILREMAVSNQCLDYLEGKVGDSEKYFTTDFIDSMRNLTTEEIFAMKKEIDESPIVFQDGIFQVSTSLQKKKTLGGMHENSSK